MEDVLRLLQINAYHVWSRCIVGNPAPATAEMYKRISNPVVGDLVMEITGIWHDGQNADRLGRLVSVADEHRYTQADVDNGNIEPEDLNLTNRITTIRTLDGREVRWDNCKFIVVADSLKFPDHA